MADDPPRRGPSQQEDREDGNSGASPQSWLERRLRGLCQDDFEGGLRIYCTSNLEPPEAFRDVWHVISEESDLSAGTPMLSEEDSAELHTILVFCNQDNRNEVGRLRDIVVNIDLSSHDTPPMFWVPHSVAPDQRGQGSSDFERPDVVYDILHKGLDGIVSGEPEGLRLAMAVCSKIRKSASLSRNLADMIAEARTRGQYAQYLQHCAHETLWGYVRPRLAPEIPPIDNNLEPGDPQELPGFTVGIKLGQGRYGSVYKLTERPEVGNDVQAVKVVPTEGIADINDLKYINRMVHVMKMLSGEQGRHPNIIRLYQTYHTPTHILFRLEYGGPENLYHRLHQRQEEQAERQRPLPLHKAVKIVIQAVEAVWHLHAVAQVFHRDIKPENIILNETPETVTIKLADLDLAVAIQEASKMCRSPCGTAQFAAPEVLLDSHYDGCLADMWSLGVVLAEVFCEVRVVELAVKNARPDAQPERANTAFAECIRAFFQTPAVVADLLEERCRPELRSLLPLGSAMLTGMLKVDPAQRMEADEVHSVVEEGLRWSRGPSRPPGRPRPAAGGAAPHAGRRSS